MNDTQAITTVPVSRTCEDADCHRPAEIATIVTGDYGADGIAVYCEECAADRDDSANHTAIAEVAHR